MNSLYTKQYIHGITFTILFNSKNNSVTELILSTLPRWRMVKILTKCHQRIKWLTWELNLGISSSKALFLILPLLSSLCFFCTFPSFVELFIHFWFELSNYNCIFWRYGRVIKTSHIDVPFSNGWIMLMKLCVFHSLHVELFSFDPLFNITSLDNTCWQ